MPNRLRLAEDKLLPLRMACNSIALARGARIRDPEQRRLHDQRLRNLAADEAARPFAASRRPDLFKSQREREEMNEAYQRMMASYAYEHPDIRDRASRPFVAWIARYARPRATCQDICRFAAEAGALQP